MNDEPRKKIVFLFRYGLKDHAELHSAIPEILQGLGEKNDVVYIGPNKKGIPEKWNFPGVRYEGLPYAVNRGSSRDKLFKTILWYIFLPFIALHCRFIRADLIWIDESVPLVGLAVQLISGRPVVMTVVDFFMEIYKEIYPWLAPLAKMVLGLEKISWKKARGFVTRAESMRKYLIKYGVPGEKIFTIRDSFSLDVFMPQPSPELRAKYGFGEKDIVLGHHGILHPNKGIGRVLNWLVPLMRSDPHLKFLVVGGGPELGTLKEQVQKENLGQQVIFTGWLPNSREVAEHLNACDIGLVMRIGQFSDHFHVTGTLVHCLMCSLPVLAARLEGICEMVTDGDVGLLFDPVSGEEFIAGLKLLMTDAGLRRQMGVKGREKAVATFDPRIVTANTVNTLEQLLKS